MLKFRPMTEKEYEILLEKEAKESYIKDIEVYKEKFTKFLKEKHQENLLKNNSGKCSLSKKNHLIISFGLLVLKNLDEYIGYIWYTIRPERKRTLLSYVFVEEKFRGQGYGKEMIHYMENHLKEHFPKIKKMVLQVFRHNPRAMQLYKRLGFKTFFKSFAGWNMFKFIRRR